MKTSEEKNPDLERYPPRVRETMRRTEVLLSIANGRLGYGLSFEETVKKHYGTLEKFWQFELPEPRPASSFVDFIRRFHVEAREDTSAFVASCLTKLLKDAINMRQPWINRNQFVPDRAAESPLQDFIVDQRRAAEWLMSMPRHRDLLPQSLQDFIEGQDARVPSAVTQGKRARGADAETAPQAPDTPQLSDAITALRELWPDAPPGPNRKAMQLAIEEKLQRPVSLSTVDRARKLAWPVVKRRHDDVDDT
jgi:hypothetical protein